jgi:predicted lysophospholipase L1 biosynthesis ABC-type transport system permease subunit
VTGIVGALTFADGVDDATTHPERFGVYAQLVSFYGFNGEDLAPADEASAAIDADPDVVAVNDNRNGVAEAAGVDLSVFTIDPVDAPPPVVMIEGTLPSSDDEVALAPDTAEEIGVAVGDRFELQGAADTAELTVTGLAFVPEGPHNEYDGGGWLTPEGFDRVVGAFKFHWADVTLREGADVDAVAERLNAQVAEQLGYPPDSAVVEPLSPPSRIGELKQLARLPLYLAAFLALLAVTAVGHAVATAVRRRRNDLAVLRAVGLTRRQTRAIVFTQATVLALVGLVVGVPLGIAAGQSLWRSVAESTPVIHITPVAALALVLIAPVVLVLANLLAAVPSHRAASLRVGQVLRTE